MSMTLKRPPPFIRQTGPKIEANTIKVYSNGKILRISGDLAEQLFDGDIGYLTPFIGQDQTLVLKVASKNDFRKGTVLKTWQSSPEAKSVLVSLTGLLPSLGLTEATAPGTYKAEVKDNMLMIYFGRKL